ncbi:hypothetical protein ACW2QC_06075 [Virgibacillus sp. FSP13]
MITLLALLAIALFLIITKTQFFKRKPNNKLTTQLAMAILVGIITMGTYFTNDGETASKYIVLGMGIMSFIAILVEMIISKKQQTTS